jgi:uncharacterized SAM-binding protein YcdF (DUF218 family)
MTYTQPLLAIFLCACLMGLIFLRHSNPRRSRKFLIIGILGIFLSSWEPAAWLFSRPLEIWFPEHTVDTAAAQAIVVPGGDYDDPTVERPFVIATRETYGRCVLAAYLYRTGSPRPVVVSGLWASAVMRRILEKEGVPAGAIWEEKAARSTHENAAFSARILRSHGISTIALVSEAQSMLRAKLSFQKQGLQVIPAVGERLTLNSGTHLLPHWRGIARNEDTLHEAVGLLWYRLRGWV